MTSPARPAVVDQRSISRSVRMSSAFLALGNCSRTPPPVPLPETERGRKTFCSPSPLRGGGRGEGCGQRRCTLHRSQGGQASAAGATLNKLLTTAAPTAMTVLNFSPFCFNPPPAQLTRWGRHSCLSGRQECLPHQEMNDA